LCNEPPPEEGVEEKTAAEKISAKYGGNELSTEGHENRHALHFLYETLEKPPLVQKETPFGAQMIDLSTAEENLLSTSEAENGIWEKFRATCAESIEGNKENFKNLLEWQQAFLMAESVLAEGRETLIAYTNTRWEKRDALKDTLLAEAFDLAALETAIAEAIEADVKIIAPELIGSAEARIDLEAAVAKLEEKTSQYDELRAILDEPAEEQTEERTAQEEQAAALVEELRLGLSSAQGCAARVGSVGDSEVPLGTRWSEILEKITGITASPEDE